jgi:hypothetical protein
MQLTLIAMVAYVPSDRNLLVMIPLYQSEVSPHTHRGLFVGLHGVMLCVG